MRGLYARLCAGLLRLTPLWREIRSFSEWLENSIARLPTEQIRLEISEEPAVVLASAAGEAQPPPQSSRLARFFRECGIFSLVLERRLESNQISDLMTLLFTHSRALRRRQGAASGDEVVRRLHSSAGINVYCTNTRLSGGTLIIRYTYCMTMFSRVAKWFTRLKTGFGDHRTLFWLAPRLGLLFALAPMLVFLIYALHDGWRLLLVASLLGSAVLFLSTYCFLMIIGSIEYDNESAAFELQQANRKLRCYAERIDEDLERARAVQQRLLPDPDRMPLAEQIEWGTSFIPQEKVGGDYFDVAILDEGRVAILFADVCGHGLAAALVTMIIKTTFEGWIDQGWDLPKVISVLNRRLFELTENGSFAAVIVGIYDSNASELRYSNCGHLPLPYLIGKGDGAPQPLDAAGVMILGFLEQIATPSATVCVNPGDTVLLATDGVTEALDRQGEQFSVEALEDFLASHHHLSIKNLVSELVDTVGRHAQDVSECDDRAILAFRPREFRATKQASQ